MKFWTWQVENLPSITHAIRTAVAATVSVIIARLVQMPEAYWAAIATFVVMQSTLGATLTLSIERIVATDIHVDQPIDIVFPDQGGKTVQAKVATTSESITPNSRTLLVELHLDNPNNQIQPGSYAQARLTAGSLGQIAALPNNTLLFRAQGLQVGVVKSGGEPDNKVELRDIKVGRDFGTTIEVVQGVTPSDKVILNPADSLVSGDVVRIAATPSPSPATEVAKK